MPDMLDKSPTVTRVVAGELCTGCGLCAALAPDAIRMTEAAPGYARPAQSGKITEEDERSIAAACPGAVVAPWSGDAVHPYWGPFHSVATGAATDPDIRFQGSSGGAISALLVYAVERGVVDRVLHVAADPAAPTRNVTALSRTASEIVSRAGSRYTASSPMADIARELDAGGTFAFVGKPCDASALRLLATRDPRVARQVPIVISFFCGGIPSHGGVARILDKMGVRLEAVRTFRYRGRGWPGSCVAETDEGSAEMSYAESWGGHLSKEVQFRCKICPDAVGGVADIACADAWYGDDEGYPSFSEQDGRSLIVTRSEAGQRLLDAAIDEGRLTVEPLDIDEIDKMQPSQARRKRLILARSAALPFTLQPLPRMSGLKVGEAARRARPRETIQNFIGTLRRTLMGTRSSR